MLLASCYRVHDAAAFLDAFIEAATEAARVRMLRSGSRRQTLYPRARMAKGLSESSRAAAVLRSPRHNARRWLIDD